MNERFEELLHFVNDFQSLAERIYDACTYDNEQEAQKGNYGLPRDVWERLGDLVQQSHDIKDKQEAPLC